MSLTASCEVGRRFRTRLTIDRALIERFAEFSGDRNPLHVDQKAAQAYGYPREVAHGAIAMAALSKLIGTDAPGPGAMWMSHSIQWLSPMLVGDEVELVATVARASTGTGVICLEIAATNQRGRPVLTGEATVKVAQPLGRLERAEAPNGPPAAAVVAPPAPAASPRVQPSAQPLGQGAAVTGGRVALVTGGSRGIGAAIASRLAADGTTVVITYHRSQQDAEALVQGLTQAGGRARCVGADVSEPSASARLVDDVLAAHGRLDIIVHGASPLIQPLDAATTRYEDLEPYVAIYAGSALALVAGAAPGMQERRFGRLIMLGTSFLFGMPPARLAPYVAAKQALWGLVKSWAVELGPHGITANMVSPGMTVTDLTADIPARVKELEARKSPLRRLATVDDTANLVAFLASDAAGYLNGVNIPLTGGPS